MAVGIIGAGASGCICAYYLLKFGLEITLFDASSPLLTLLPTGGGRCNLAHAEYDFKELVKNYPRGEKFLYSVFSQFSTADTIEMFENIGVKTYTQDDGRIFPVSNSAKDVREKILKAIKDVQIIKEGVNVITPSTDGFKLRTAKAEYYFDKIVIATGWGKYNNNTLFENLNHTIVPPKPSLVGLNCKTEKLSGVVLKNVYSKDCKISGNLLFTHFGISGPLVYTISSINARKNFPYNLVFDLHPDNLDLQALLNSNPHKDLKNILSNIFPHRFAEYIFGNFAEIKAHNIDGKTRDFISDKIHNFELEIKGTNKGEETVTSGGFNLNEINPKTMESKLHPNLYIIGEALDIDGFCGGFNLQNAWSTAYVAAKGLTAK